MNIDMLNELMDTTVDRLRTAKSKGRFFMGAAADEIAAVESRLGVVLPYSYRRFLRTLGCGSFRGHEFFGIVPGTPVAGGGTPLVVDVNEFARQTGSKVLLPTAWICVAESGNGWCYVLRTDIRTSLAAHEYESPVDAWFAGNPLANADRMASSFAEFFKNQISEAIARP